MVGCYLPKLGNFFQEREVRTWLLVIVAGLCFLAKDQDTLIEQSVLLILVME